MKKFFKWLLLLFVAAITLVAGAVVVLLLSYNWILREVITHRIHAQTGMDVEIGGLKIAVDPPTMEIRDLKLYNLPNFGGSPFFDIREIHAEFDSAALARKEIHVTLMRFNLGELDIVKNQAGQTNIFMSVAGVPSSRSGGGKAAASFKQQSGYDFTGIDKLYLSVGTLKYIDLGNTNNNRETIIDLKDWIVPDVKSTDDLISAAAYVALLSNGFFDFMKGDRKPVSDVLKQLGL